MTETTLTWIVGHSLCPTCGRGALEVHSDSMKCRACSVSFPVVDDAIDFLDEDTKPKFGIVGTENVSDHPFDVNALTIIDACPTEDSVVPAVARARSTTPGLGI